MLDFTRYVKPLASAWNGRADTPTNSCFFQIIKMLDLSVEINISHSSHLKFAFIGFQCDEGIRRNLGRVGAAKGPFALRETLAKFPIHTKEVDCYDAGDITCHDGNLSASQESLADAVYLLLKHDFIPIVIGGGHELAFGHYLGIAKQYPQENLSIVNFDAHFDMRPLLPHNEGSSGTPFLQIATEHKSHHRRFDYNCIGIQLSGNVPLLFETAKKYDTKILLAEEFLNFDAQPKTEFINRIISDNEIIYLSLCLDVFASAFAPGVSAPQALGLSPWHLIPLVRQLAKSGKVISYDLAEFSPKFDVDHRTAKLAASFIYEIIHHHVSSKGK